MRTKQQYNNWRRHNRMIRFLEGKCEECNNDRGNYRRCFKHRLMRAKSQKRYKDGKTRKSCLLRTA